MGHLIAGVITQGELVRLKHIKGIIHNFTHSFMSDENYIDGGFVCHDIFKLANLNAGKTVRISWLPPRDEELFKLTPRVRKTVLAYRKWLPELCNSHNVPVLYISEFYTEIYRAENHQIYVNAIAIDCNGKAYHLPVWV